MPVPVGTHVNETARSRSISAKVAFVVIAGGVLAAIWVLAVAWLFRRRYAALDAKASEAWYRVWWATFFSLFNLAFLFLGSVTWRRWYAGRHWAREVFVAMSIVAALSTVGFLAAVALWYRRQDESFYIEGGLKGGFPLAVAIVFLIAAWLLFGLAGVAAAWLWGLARQSNLGGPMKNLVILLLLLAVPLQAQTTATATCQTFGNTTTCNGQSYDNSSINQSFAQLGAAVGGIIAQNRANAAWKEEANAEAYDKMFAALHSHWVVVVGATIAPNGIAMKYGVVDSNNVTVAGAHRIVWSGVSTAAPQQQGGRFYDAVFAYSDLDCDRNKRVMYYQVFFLGSTPVGHWAGKHEEDLKVFATKSYVCGRFGVSVDTGAHALTDTMPR